MAVVHWSVGHANKLEVFEGGSEEEVLEAILEWFRGFNPVGAPVFRVICWDYKPDQGERQEHAAVYYELA